MKAVAALTERRVMDLPVAARLERFLAVLILASPLIISAVGSLLVLQVIAVVLTDHALVQEKLLPLLQLPLLVLLLQLQRFLPLPFRGKILGSQGSLSY
jgi:hypothetical protein